MQSKRNKWRASRLPRKQDGPAYWKEHDVPANLTCCFCFNLPRSPHPANLSLEHATSAPVLIYLEGRVIMLTKKSMVLSRACFLLPPSCLFDFKAKSQEQGKSKRARSKQTNTPLFVLLLRSLLPADSKAHDPASLTASNLPMHTEQNNTNRQGA